MNPLQQIWLKVLTPVSYLFNERLAKRSGLLGRFARFFMIGPREYGVHPFNRMLIFANRKILFGQAIMLHRYSVIKGMTHNGYHMIRPLRTISFVPPLLVLLGITRLLFPGQDYFGYNPDTLNYLLDRTGDDYQLPLNSLNQRVSAHYVQISTLYQAEMLKKYHKVHGQIIEERLLASEKERKTRYADASYKYEPMVPVHIPELKVL